MRILIGKLRERFVEILAVNILSGLDGVRTEKQVLQRMLFLQIKDCEITGEILPSGGGRRCCVGESFQSFLVTRNLERNGRRTSTIVLCMLLK